MSTLSVDVNPTECVKSVDTSCSVSEIDEYDFSRFPDRPRNLNVDRERQRSFDERSLVDLPGFSPPMSSRADNISRIDHFDGLPFSPALTFVTVKLSKTTLIQNYYYGGSFTRFP
ncbi:hypothetical protein POM88_010409 [Heracleum sosnowskyi]|uniref:Uncharacterized protein n=1 Tax=Heracleum sosnowskyi TaxID=360622 RepID=A0AAD8N1G6_9APIA|nr:hypothetical protein POM88_010409 [Heracleum sosnowskyi]